MYLGCEENFGFVAESMQGHYGLALWPPPLVAPVNFYRDGDVDFNLKSHISLSDAQFVFREDSFDPGMRIRRGRIYRKDTNGQPQKWQILPDPTVPMTHLPRNGPYVQMDMQVFRHLRMKDIAEVPSLIPLVLLGVGDAHSLWRVVDYERNAFGEDITTLKAVSYLGVLPQVNLAIIPEAGRTKAKECIEKVVDTAYTAGPESVIDRCRDAASALLAAFLSDKNPKAMEPDLSKLIKMLESDDQGKTKGVVLNSGRTIARLHSRAKPNAKAMHGAPPVYEADAELCLHCLGAIIRDLGYATR